MFAQSLVTESFFDLLSFVVQDGHFHDDLTQLANELSRMLRSFAKCEYDLPSLHCLTFISETFECNTFFEFTNYSDFLRCFGRFSFDSKVGFFRRLLSYVPKSGLPVLFKSQVFSTIISRGFDHSDDAQFGPELRAAILRWLPVSIKSFLSVFWRSDILKTSMDRGRFEYFRLTWQIFKRWPKSANTFEQAGFHVDLLRDIRHSFDHYQDKNRRFSRIFSRTLSAFNDAYFTVNRSVKKLFGAGPVSRLAKKYEDFKFSIMFRAVEFDAGLPAGESGGHRLILSIAQLKPEFARDAFEELGRHRRPLGTEHTTRWVPTLVDGVCRLFRESRTLSDEEAKSVVGQLVAELEAAEPGPLLEELARNTRAIDTGQAERIRGRIGAAVTHIEISRDVVTLACCVGTQESAVEWAAKVVAAAAGKVKQAMSDKEGKTIGEAARRVIATGEFVKGLSGTFEIRVVRTQLSREELERFAEAASGIVGAVGEQAAAVLTRWRAEGGSSGSIMSH
jgi:hypothetical protein